MTFKVAIDDIAQRVITANKRDQKENLRKMLRNLFSRKGAKALDFGCGTALFAPVFHELGFVYYGYDIDEDLLDHASRVYPYGRFVRTKLDLIGGHKYDVIVANCCFHHIGNACLSQELELISSLLLDDGVFFMIDILAPDVDRGWLHKQFMKLERGLHIRHEMDYVDLVV